MLMSPAEVDIPPGIMYTVFTTKVMYSRKMKILLTGATGMVGEGVLRQCLESPNISEVLAITRKTSGIDHPKFKEFICKDFFNLSEIEDRLKDYDACFFCAGISSLGVQEKRYHRITYDMTLHFAKTLEEVAPQLVFCYISGAGTDSSEKGKLMWARVKGKTENDLLKLELKVFNFRPAFMKPRKEAKHAPAFYKYIGWLHKVGEKLFPQYFCTTDELAMAMIKVAQNGYPKHILEVSDMKKLADPQR